MTNLKYSDFWSKPTYVMTVGQVSFKILPLLLLFYINYAPVTCQNCGLPSTIRVNEHLPESLDTGQQILPPIAAYNVEKILKVTKNPANFANVTFIPKTESSNALLSLEVGTPLWSPSSISYIDKTRNTDLKIGVELECSDGRKKGIEIIIQTIDENTAVPYFETSEYKLFTEPCTQEQCALVFDTDIIAIDKDRDKENAEIYVWTNVPEINFLHNYSTLETWFENDDYGGQKPKGYQSRVKLEYKPAKTAIQPPSISFTIYVNNTVRPAEKTDFIALSSSNVTIHFVENPQRMIAPVFTSPMYYAIVEYKNEQVSIQPGNIFASLPGHHYNESVIHYIIEGKPDTFRIDYSGNLSFIKNKGITDKVGSIVAEYNVTAERKNTAGDVVASSKVPLVVLFLDNPDSTEEPPCDCESTSTTPWPATTCPSTTCPVPDPCPETTTTPPTTGSPYTTTTRWPSTLTTTSTSENPGSSTSTTTEWTSTVTTTSSTPGATEPVSTTNPYPTTTVTPPTLPPGDCRCNCKNFTCEDPQVKPSLNSTSYTFYPDPYSCTTYHQCRNHWDDPAYEDVVTFECPPTTVFCPMMSACTTVEMCLHRTFHIEAQRSGGAFDDEETCKDCQCRIGLPPEDPGNLCTSDNHESLIPDEKFYDIFHKCQLFGDGNDDSYIDYPMKCPSGLIFCKNSRRCGYHDDSNCKREKNLIFKQCDVYKMGKWEGFNIFKKSFI